MEGLRGGDSSLYNIVVTFEGVVGGGRGGGQIGGAAACIWTVICWGGKYVGDDPSLTHTHINSPPHVTRPHSIHTLNFHFSLSPNRNYLKFQRIIYI